MPELLQYTLQPAARLIRLMLGEYGVAHTLREVRPWRREKELLEIDPSAEGPIMLVEDLPPIVGVSAVMLHIEERFAHTAADTTLFPSGAANRAETRRLLDWVLHKLNDEVTRYVIEEKVVKRDISAAPEPSVLRAAKANLGEHLAYLGFLFATRRWLAGESMTIADFALAAHLSSLDYLGDVPWDEAGEVKLWYQRIKSRPAFRTLLADRVVPIPAAAHYADLDF